MTVPYATSSGTAGYSQILAISAAIDARTRQYAPLLPVLGTYRTVIRPGGFISLPRPATPTTVAIISRAVTLGSTTAELAIEAGNAQLVIDERDLSAGGQIQTRTPEPTAYRWLSNRIWRLSYYGAAGLIDSLGGYGYRADGGYGGYEGEVWIDGVMGWGNRVPVRTEYPGTLSVSADTMTYTDGAEGATPPPQGTVYQWGRELMAVREVRGTASPWTLALDRGMAETERAGHAANTDLFRLDAPANLREATTIVAKRWGQIDKQPGAGPAADPTGDITPSLYRNIDHLLLEYMRPAEA